MAIPARRMMLAVLVVVFFVQTWMVYTDPAGRAAAPLSPQAARGSELWHENNCQSCHQLYGFGGFLGPDLTNAASRLSAERLTAILTAGSELMPPFGFSVEEREALARFFEELDLTGVGQARAPDVKPPGELMASLFAGTDTPTDGLTDPERLGFSILAAQNCIDCHLPNATSAYQAADLTTITSTRERDELAQVLAAGVPGKAMPRFAFPPHEVDAVHAALARLERHGDTIRAAFEAAAGADDEALLSLPWFEYPRETPP